MRETFWSEIFYGHEGCEGTCIIVRKNDFGHKSPTDIIIISLDPTKTIIVDSKTILKDIPMWMQARSFPKIPNDSNRKEYDDAYNYNMPSNEQEINLYIGQNVEVGHDLERIEGLNIKYYRSTKSLKNLLHERKDTVPEGPLGITLSEKLTPFRSIGATGASIVLGAQGMLTAHLDKALQLEVAKQSKYVKGIEPRSYILNKTDIKKININNKQPDSLKRELSKKEMQKILESSNSDELYKRLINKNNETRNR